MPKYVEQLTVEDLKKAFREYLKQSLVPTNQQVHEWVKFLALVREHCSIVERM